MREEQSGQQNKTDADLEMVSTVSFLFRGH